MNEYIFYTPEGYTYPPKEDKEVENCQLLGRICGNNQEDARKQLTSNSPWIEECGFDINEAIAKQILTETNKEDIMTLVEYLWEDEECHFKEVGMPKNHIFMVLKRLKNLCK